MKKVLKSILAKYFTFKRLMEKYEAECALEKDIAFLQSQHGKMFKMSEEEMREKLANLQDKRVNSSLSDDEHKEVQELEQLIANYNSIETIFKKTKDEYALIRKYIDFLEKKQYKNIEITIKK